MRLFNQPLISLGNKEQKELLWQYRLNGDQKAYNKLVLSSGKLVLRVAYKAYRANRNTFRVEIEDLCQEGLEGLICAIKAFEDPREETNFLSFASRYIKGRIWLYIRRSEIVDKKLDCFSRKCGTKIFYNLSSLINIVSTWDPEIKQEERRKFSNKIKVPIGVIMEAEERWQSKVVEYDSNNQSISEQIDTVKLEESIKNGLSFLDPEHKLVIENKFFSDKPKTNAQLGKQLGVHRNTIDNRRSHALIALKDIFNESQIIQEYIRS